MNERYLWQALFVCLAAFILTATSCNKDSMMEETPDPMECDTENVSFSAVIVPILQEHCYQGCHNGANPVSGFSFESYDGVKAKVLEGRLYGAVAHLPGYVAMPQNQGLIPSCQISQIKAWIDAGAPDN